MWKPKSRSMPHIHKNSQIPLVIKQNSASALERATTGCFLLLHVLEFLEVDEWEERRGRRERNKEEIRES